MSGNSAGSQLLVNFMFRAWKLQECVKLKRADASALLIYQCDLTGIREEIQVEKRFRESLEDLGKPHSASGNPVEAQTISQAPKQTGQPRSLGSTCREHWFRNRYRRDRQESA